MKGGNTEKTDILVKDGLITNTGTGNKQHIAYTSSVAAFNKHYKRSILLMQSGPSQCGLRSVTPHIKFWCSQTFRRTMILQNQVMQRASCYNGRYWFIFTSNILLVDGNCDVTL